MDARTYPAKATPKSLRTRARILDAAMRLFAEVGYHAATNAMIADAAKLTRGAMLYHFGSREELVEAAAQVGDRFGPLIQAGADPRFQTSRDLGRFLLEGLAKGAMTYEEPARRERLLAVVKRAVRMLNRKGDIQELWSE
jgi:AcrR family transcriptional regulator